MEADYVGNLEQVNGDVKERDNIYVVELELTEFDKDDIRVYFNDGYLVITAQNKLFLEKQIRRAFYIGREIAQEHIRVAFNNGSLKCMIPKGERKEGQGSIEIEII